MQQETTKKQLRSFGLMVGGIFALIGIWPLVFRQQVPRWWCIALAAYLAASAVIAPVSLHWVYKRWMWLGTVMGWINTRIILGLAFFGLVTPMGLFRSWLLHKDPLGRRLQPEADSYRVRREARPASHLTKQY
jgi:hypothetical protein